jgi:Winged helix DNA-binding domain
MKDRLAMVPDIAHDALDMIEYGDQPNVVVLADSEAAATRARVSAERAGCRISDSVGLAGWAERLDRQISMDGTIVELDGDHGADLDRLLDRLESNARQGRHGSVISAPAELIDAIAARTAHPRVIHLCGASELDRVTAIAVAAARAPARLHDVNKGEGPPRLQQLSEEVGRIATILATLSEEEEAAAQAEPEAPEQGARTVEAGQIRAMIRARRLREQYFPAELFADPAWDMLLDLMAARLEKQRVAVSSLCIAAAVPATTALRWIKTLTDQGLFVRAADPQDGRRVFIELSDKAAAGLSAYLRAAARISPLAI